jgi:hypothetical protein
MNNIFDNIFKAQKPTVNETSVNQANVNQVTVNKDNVYQNINNLLNSNKPAESVSISKSSTDNSNLMNQINALNEKIISSNKQNEQLTNENKVLRANLELLMRRFNLRFN